MKKLSILFILVVALILSGCNFPGFDAEAPDDSDDALATEIAKILTGTPEEIDDPSEPEPIETEAPDPTPTATEEPEQPTATAEPTATQTIAPTATLTDTDPVQTLGAATWTDNMSSPNNWPTGFNEFTSISFSDGFLKLTANKNLDGWRLSWPVIEDFYLEGTFQAPDCEGSDHYGFIFRVPKEVDADRGYLFGVTCDGRYSLRRWDSKNMVFLVNRTSHASIKEGDNAVNKLGIMARGDSIALYINGQKVNEVKDSTFSTGQFGIFVGGSEDFTVWVDQVRYWLNP